MIKSGQKKPENILYGVLWAILFAAPIFALYVSGLFSPGSSYYWKSVFDAWQLLLMFFATFLIHNLLLAPLLVYGNKRWTYVPLLLLLLVCFELYQCFGRPHPDAPKRKPVNKERMMPPPRHPEDGERSDQPDFFMDGRPHDKQPQDMKKPRKGHPRNPHSEPPMPFGGENMVAFLIMSMLMGLNIGAKYYFKTADARKRLRERERENLNQQLKYLKYQVNPHFFMNTLNNIHALVDINPEEAKTTIEVLSHLMRYMLYESDKTWVLLRSELEFITNYIDLMRIRYTEKVRIDVHLPEKVPDIYIPPLLFIIFVENAFKHGISYEHDSFVEVRVEIKGKNIDFICLNSRKTGKDEVHGGIGLQNVIKRLDLIYTDEYRLNILPTEQTYRVELRIPSNQNIKTHHDD